MCREPEAVHGQAVYAYKEPLWSRAAAIESWAVRLKMQAEHVKNIYVFCGNHYEGFAPATCRQLGGRLGLRSPCRRMAKRPGGGWGR